MPHRLSAAGAAVVGLLAAAGSAAGASPDVLYTTSADFDRGTLVAVNHDAPDQLQLDAGRPALPFVTVAASKRGTIIRIDADTGRIVGEYISAPEDRGGDPSAVAIDRKGNAWYADRAEHGNNQGAVGRVGVVVGGTRVRADRTPDPGGDYLKGPFDYNTCADRNGDGLIATSRGLGDMRPWTNRGGADNHGGVSTAADECVTAYARVAGQWTQFVAVDAADDVWTGGIDKDAAWQPQFEVVDGKTGERTGANDNPKLSPKCGGENGVIDRAGVLWSGGGGAAWLRYDGASTCHGTFEPEGEQGFALDPVTGDVWYAANDQVERLTGVPVSFTVGEAITNALALDRAGNVWVLDAGIGVVKHFRKDGALVGDVPLPGEAPTGVAVDANGKVWVTTRDDDAAHRIDPNAGPVGRDGRRIGAVDLTVPLGLGAGPENNSDFTGASLGAANPLGTWTVRQDAGYAGARWDAITFNREPAGRVPAGANIRIEARAADSLAALAEAPVSRAPTGRFVEVRAVLIRAPGGASPVLSDLRVKATSPAAGDADPAPPPDSPPVAPEPFSPPPSAVGSRPVSGAPTAARGSSSSARHCASRRAFRIRVRRRHGVVLTSVVVFVNGRRVAVRRGARITAPVVLRRLPKGRYKVTIVGRTSTGKVLRSTRRYWTCTKRRPPRRPAVL